MDMCCKMLYVVNGVRVGGGMVFHGDLHFMRSLAPLEVEPLQLYGDVSYIEETASLSPSSVKAIDAWPQMCAS